jgi:bifunctional UDP-N-acetylglucosamine pyrophosphorylase / glucosamine-1-phosphate N-acetyltransferase
VTQKPSRRLAVVVMAAGKGKRLKSALPKVLHPICGKPVLWYVLGAARKLRPDRLIVVVGHDRGRVEEAVSSWGIRATFVDQAEPLGTGHAVMVAERAVGRAHDVLVLPGDEPLVTVEQLRELLRVHRRRGPAAVAQSTEIPDPGGFGRVVREGRSLVRITEGDEASAEEREIREVATSVYVFRREDLFKALPLVSRETKQGEYYLHHVLRILIEKGEEVMVHRVDNGGSVGANSRAELAGAAAVLRNRINQDLMAAGVTLLDPDRTYVDSGVRVGPDTTLLPGVHLEGETRIGSGCVVGPDTRIVDTRVGDRVEITYAVVRGARIEEDSTVGPYANIRPGTVLGKRAKAGSFVEIKNSRIGEDSKVPHLAYVGDARVGKDVNVGAGTITCNYDGVRKHRTVIGDGAFIGSDTMLVAPVRIGRGAVTGAGSTITRDVPPGALAVERSEQRTVRGYRERTRRRG